ncbi:MAG: hypothetical protein EAZ13_10815 [Sphingobacteriia bacterium]|nr:MAG: hypothetical protein EAZ41_00530 [Sphingobacteriia bacterium]TAG30018.1 MAG: hypothetical protein EAZ35_08555 [Sphingobacteriia bacterium]TAH05964.1 MAG: hypothetical protein EAZ13_10815 [Sphingobacteriia bacterium]
MQEIFPDFILADLYPNSIVLVEAGEKKPDKAILTEQKTNVVEPETTKSVEKNIISAAITGVVAKERPSKWYLGDNGKRIVILVKEAEAVFLNEENLDFLTKILGACKLNMGDIAVVNMVQYTPLLTEIKAELNPLVCLLFDVAATTIQLPFTIPNYQVQAYDGCQFLIAPPLSIFKGSEEAAKLEKTKLWVSLKKIFNL